MTVQNLRLVNKISLMELPDLDSMPMGDRKLFRKIDDYWKTTQSGLPRLLEWLNMDPANKQIYGDISPEELEHELSDWIPGIDARTQSPSRSLNEINGLAQITSACPREIFFSNNPENLKQLLIQFSLFANGNSKFRSGEISTKEDAVGSKVIYPDAKFISQRIHDLFFLCRKHIDISPAFCATVSMIALCNAHPLEDGNGRVSRMLFNWILSDGRTILNYLPIYELAALSRGGFIIRSRKAQYFNDWTELIRFLEYSSSIFIGNQILINANS